MWSPALQEQIKETLKKGEELKLLVKEIYEERHTRVLGHGNGNGSRCNPNLQ